ncbi:hypothetical protein FKM82_022339 [Ascaphus truei]
MTRVPPGCRLTQLLMLYTLRSMTSHLSVFRLCFVTSSQL